MIKIIIFLFSIVSTNLLAAEKLTCDKYDNPNINVDLSSVRDDLQRKIDNLDTLVKELTKARLLLKDGIESEAQWLIAHDLALSTRLLANTTFAVGSVWISTPAVIGISLIKSITEITNNAINASSQDEAMKGTLLDLGKQQIELISTGIAKSLGKEILEKSISGAFAAIDVVSQFEQTIKDSKFSSTTMDPKQLNGMAKQILKYTENLNALKKELANVNKKLKENGLEKKLESEFLKAINKHKKLTNKSCENKAENANKINPPVIESVSLHNLVSNPNQQLVDIKFKDLDGDVEKIKYVADGAINNSSEINKTQLSKYTNLEQIQGVTLKDLIVGSCLSKRGIFNLIVSAYDSMGHSSKTNKTSWRCPEAPNSSSGNSYSLGGKGPFGGVIVALTRWSAIGVEVYETDGLPPELIMNGPTSGTREEIFEFSSRFRLFNNDGYTGNWVLPSKEELQAIFEYKDNLTGFSEGSYITWNELNGQPNSILNFQNGEWFSARRNERYHMRLVHRFCYYPFFQDSCLGVDSPREY